VRAVRFNHVSIHADDLESSARFYEDFFGMERLPTPRFRQRVQWLRLGDQQLHLFQRDGTDPPRFHHVALDVDDFEAAYRKARDLGLLDTETWDSPIREHPSGWVQMYIRDPAGNLVEIDHAGKDRLPEDLRSQVKPVWDFNEQSDENMSGRLYVPE
jgi:catechol 2,3-dioxygenase-like lactoylglutathione lyase family enzyme